jgi:hypothetical protein
MSLLKLTFFEARRNAIDGYVRKNYLSKVVIKKWIRDIQLGQNK